MEKLNTSILSLGSNLGDSIAIIENAYQKLEDTAGTIQQQSAFYKSEAWGFKSDNTFINTCVQLETKLSPEELLMNLKEIERELGRKPKISSNYEDRSIDIDIIFYNALIFRNGELQLPHPKFYHRKFVLQPLHEIQADFQDPLTGLTITQLLVNTKDNTSVKQL